MNIKRETKYFRDFVQYPKQKFFAFPHPRVCSEHVLKFGAFFILTFL